MLQNTPAHNQQWRDCDEKMAKTLRAFINGGYSHALGFPPGHATALTFDGNICGGGNTCSNGSVIDQTYGDITGC